jgi:hypothetical protein
MKNRNLLTIGGAILVIILVGGLLFWNYFQTLLAMPTLDITYATTQTMMPDGAACAGGSGESTGVAKEIIDLETDYIYVAGGTNPMPDDVWANYSFRLPIFQNSTRNLLFEGSCFFRSPDAALDCVGDACFNIDEIAGYTWLSLTQLAGQSCFPDASGCSSDVVNPGFVSISTIAKCQYIRYDGPVIYELSDGQGNLYVMHATATGTPDLNPTLPQGWILTERTIDEPLELLPFGGGTTCYYNIVRDNLVQSYHQYAYVTDRYPSGS